MDHGPNGWGRGRTPASGGLAKVAASSPKELSFRMFQADGHRGLGGLLKQTDRLEEAEAECRRAHEIRRSLAESDPGDPTYRRDVANAQSELADLLAASAAAEASEVHGQAMAIGEALTAEYPGEVDYRMVLASCLSRRAQARRDRGDPAGAASDARRAIVLFDGLPTLSTEGHFEAACSHAALVGLAGVSGSGVSANESSSHARAMERLQWAASMGYRNSATFRMEDSLDTLRTGPTSAC